VSDRSCMRGMLCMMPPFTPDIHISPDASETDYAYLAGILDGEGYFSASPKTNSFGLRVAMTERAAIDFIHSRFAGNLSNGGKTSTGNQVHVWYLQRLADLDHVLPRLMPYLHLKTAEAEAMLELVQHKIARPRWDVPSSRLSPQQRLREGRRDVVRAWTERSLELRTAVVTARSGRDDDVGVKRVR
jgi:hypothetical protein